MGRVAAVALLWLAAVAGEYLDRRHDHVYRHWRGLRYGCLCDLDGSVSSACDIVTGQCVCQPHVVGASCDRCQVGYFDLRPGLGCRRCDCDPAGSSRSACNPITGRCLCKPGVGGERCTACLPGYFHLSDNGCQECGPCSLPGRRCDPDTGQCSCPPNTVGSSCQQCARGFWGRHAIRGCKRCDCGRRGSVSSYCDPWTGKCGCFFGFGGRRCDDCALGYHNFPRCRRCRCHPAGSHGCDARHNCPCDRDGRCRCKRNVVGDRCDQCAADTFSLSASNPDGCTACFCFTRSGQCSQAEFSWVPLDIIETNRTVVLEYDETSETYETLPIVPWSTEDICYIHLTLPDDRAVTLTPGQSRLNVTNSLRVVPGETGDVRLGLSSPFDTPIYWQLSEPFLGDKVRSYNGELRFRLRNSGGSRHFPNSILASYPLVQLQGNDRLVLEHYPTDPARDGVHRVKFHEAFWRRKGDARTPVTREMLMVALQNTQHVLVRATESLDVTEAEISDISWDIAEPTYSNPGTPALGIERCACPSQYNGSSCQDPSIGFYRTYRRHTETSEIIIDLLGDVAPCKCHGRAVTCNPDTGWCQNCTNNTAGRHCEECASGYFGAPHSGCQRCLCPSADLFNAVSCRSYYAKTFRCHCKAGYAGDRCDRCAYGYYGNATDPAGGCVPCGCNLMGSIGRRCHPRTGQCTCRADIIGRDCTGCAPRHALSARGCEACRDGCVEALFREVDQLSDDVALVNVTGAVGAPWHRLVEVSNVTDEYLDRFVEYIETQLSLRTLFLSLDLTEFANTVLIRTEDLVSALPSNINDTQQLQEELTAILESVEATGKDAEATVVLLAKYALGQTPSVSVVGALTEANAILEQLQKRNFSAVRERADAELSLGRELLELVRGLGVNRTAVPAAHDRLEEVRQRLLDAQRLVEQQALQPTRQAEILLEQVRKGLADLSNSERTLQAGAEKCEATIANASDLQRSVETLYDITQGHAIDFSDIELQLQLANTSLQTRLGMLSNLTDDYRVRYVIPAETHASQLMMDAADLSQLFQATRQGANLSLSAAKAFQDVVDALNAARQAAKDASGSAQLAYQQAYPRDTDSLVSLGTQTKTRSERLLRAAGILQDQVVSLSEKVAASKVRLQRVNKALQEARAGNTDIIDRLQQLENMALTGAARESLRRSQETLDVSDAVLRRVEEVQSAVEEVLRPGLQELQAVGSDSLNNASRLVNEARKTLMKADLRALDVETVAADIELLSDGVGLKLQELRNKILKARQAASNIRVSLTEEAATSSCVRTYRADHLQPSTASAIRFSYAISDPATADALLFYLSGRNQKDFMAIEMVNRTIRFMWNNGGKTQTVRHPQRLATNDEQLLSDRRWYIIDAERVGNLGRLSVRPVSLAEVDWRQPDTVSAVSTAGFSIMDLSPDDPVFIGGIPDGAAGKVTAQRFAGCMDRVSVNGQPLGLWNFRSNDGCSACRVGPSDDELVTSAGHSFDGAGYAELPSLPRGQTLSRRMYSVVLNVRTYDSDALVFLAANPQKDQFFSVEVRDGRLVSRVGFGQNDVLVVTSNARYNTGNWTVVEATKYKNQMILKVNNEEDKEGAFNPESGSKVKSYDLDLDPSKLYFGGVPPDFDQSRWPLVTFVPFLGCMDDLQVGLTSQSLRTGNSSGVTGGCSGQLLKTVSFHGDGYLEMNSHRLRKTSSFSFSFRTPAADGLLLMSTFAGKRPAASDKQAEYYILALVGGRLVLRINAGLGDTTVSTDRTFNDDRFHTAHVLKTRRNIELRVADQVVGSAQLPRGSSGVQAPDDGGLYFGGLPPGVEPALESIPPPFQGCITDVIFEDELLLFDPPLRHQRVAIGRCNGDLLKGRVLHEMAAEPDPTSCNQPTQVTLEARAVKFGDDPFSHVYVPIKKKDLQNDFNITLDFRTFYPNGLLLFNDGSTRRRRAFLTLSLRDGGVVLNVQRSRRTMKLATRGRLNDGDWKMVTLQKRGRKYTLLVDGLPAAVRRGPRRLRAGSAIYIGGVPPDGVEGRGRDRAVRVSGHRRLELLRTEGFKGCIKQLEIRGRVIDLPSSRNIMYAVGQCMARVELGTLFAGDAFATYDDRFQLGDIVELAVDFRTTELSGVLISVSGPDGEPSLSLEIFDGQVVFSVYNGGAEPIRARQKFPTKFTVCDNRWHTVKANYVRHQATLKVDKYPERYGFSANGGGVIPTGGFPLYIGGLPDRAGNSLLLQPDNFQGCIRNIEINGVRRDWTDMAQLTNVLLNSCPIQS